VQRQLTPCKAGCQQMNVACWPTDSASNNKQAAEGFCADHQHSKHTCRRPCSPAQPSTATRPQHLGAPHLVAATKKRIAAANPPLMFRHTLQCSQGYVPHSLRLHGAEAHHRVASHEQRPRRNCTERHSATRNRAHYPALALTVRFDQSIVREQ